MEDWRPYRTYRQQRLETLLTEAGGPKELMRLSKVTDTYLTACRKGKRFVGDDVAGRLEEVMHRPFGWMDTPPDDAATPPAPKPSIEQALAIVADAVRQTDADRIAALAETLAGWVKGGAKEPWTGIVLQLLQPADTPTLEAQAEPATAAVRALRSLKAEPAASPSPPRQPSPPSPNGTPRPPHGEGHAA